MIRFARLTRQLIITVSNVNQGKMMASAKARTTSYQDALFIGSIAIFGVILLARIQFTPIAPNAAVAVVFPPWTRGGRAIEVAVAAGASILRLGRFPFITVVRSDEPDYAKRVIAKGAWFVLNSKTIGGCLARGGT